MVGVCWDILVWYHDRYELKHSIYLIILFQLKVPSESAPGTVVNFRAILVTRCQKEFEKDKDNQIEIDKKRKEMNDAKVRFVFKYTCRLGRVKFYALVGILSLLLRWSVLGIQKYFEVSKIALHKQFIQWLAVSTCIGNDNSINNLSQITNLYLQQENYVVVESHKPNTFQFVNFVWIRWGLGLHT